MRPLLEAHVLPGHTLLTFRVVFVWFGFVLQAAECCMPTYPSAAARFHRLLRNVESPIAAWRRALQEARIPAGPRLLLLHHLERYKYVLKPGMPLPGAPPLPPQAPSASAAQAPASHPAHHKRSAAVL